METSARFEEALTYAARLHARQKRKGTAIPYVTHLMAVAAIVGEAGGSEDQIIAGLLHDAVEDQGGAPVLAEIRRRFGPAVAGIVDGCTDTDQIPKPPWRARKEAYLAHLEEAPPEVLLVSCADKLHTARAIVADLRELGSEVWSRFSVGSGESLWYYESLCAAFRSRGLTERLVGELERTVAEMRRLSAD